MKAQLDHRIYVCIKSIPVRGFGCPHQLHQIQMKLIWTASTRPSMRPLSFLIVASVGLPIFQSTNKAHRIDMVKTDAETRFGWDYTHQISINSNSVRDSSIFFALFGFTLTVCIYLVVLSRAVWFQSENMVKYTYTHIHMYIHCTIAHSA